MDIRQMVLGAGVAALLVWGGDADTAHRGISQQAGVVSPMSKTECKLAGLKDHVQAMAERAEAAVLDAVLNAAGELEARAKQMF